MVTTFNASMADEMAMREKISQWMDGECDVDKAAYAALKRDAGYETWALYHRIGDALRDGSQCSVVSPGFNARLAQVLAAELTVIAPQAVAAARSAQEPQQSQIETTPHYRAWALAATLAAAAVVGWMATTMQDDSNRPAQLAINAPPEVEPPMMATAATPAMAEAPFSRNSDALIPADYLTTHQEYSPSTSLWTGINAYQRIDGVWGHNLSNGQ